MTLAVVRADVCGACARSECVFAPLTGIEVLETRVDGAVLVIEARLSVNLNALTIEQARADCCHEKRLVVLTVKATPLHR